ncbi:ferric-dicitrate binding protein FerR (iron transport regulator) [Pedobacter sp. AK017]|uniref:FecR family protein n=1 Tax=Pedobacter sp. AK017 TaxID=2723073 RepID=UPI00161F4A4A|nr:FecR family protein [Pedobacter sp. AK017]MBB5441276.1 ferric-dicitrate binding protein FerR (iron transport regulator) [Pedobacter sp. AK017]
MTDLNKYYQIAELIAAYVADEEKIMPASLRDWLDESEQNKTIFENVIQTERLKASVKRYQQINTDAAWANVSEILFKEDQVIRKTLWPRIVGIAAAVTAIVFGVWFFNSGRGVLKQVQDKVAYKNDIAPGKNTATLTLANGKAINLNEAKTGVVVGEYLRYNDNTVVIADPSLRSGQVAREHLLNSTDKRPLPYGRNNGQGGNDGKTQILTVSTPRGGTYQITLPDGTKVWLNAASSLKFPSTFNGLISREVELSGEAYLEVAKDAKRKFIVASKGQEVEVLGTHFNISAYNDEAVIKTTLLEGSVRVSLSRGKRIDTETSSAQAGGFDVTLRPNQQAVLTANSGPFKVLAIDPTEAIAWKSGDFVFKDEKIESIMRKLARWYNVDVVYQGNLPKSGFIGEISRFKNISAVLTLLEQTKGVHFKIEGRTVTVMK